MKTSKRYTVKPDKLQSLEDIRHEKMRLRMEIMKTENNIHEGYRDILHALTLKNLASTVMNDLSASSTVLTKAFSFGKSFLEKRRKKKHDKPNADPGEDPS